MTRRAHAAGALVTLPYDLAPVYTILEHRADEQATTLCTYVSVKRGEIRVSGITFGPNVDSVTTLWP